MGCLIVYTMDRNMCSEWPVFSCKVRPHFHSLLSFWPGCHITDPSNSEHAHRPSIHLRHTCIQAHTHTERNSTASNPRKKAKCVISVCAPILAPSPSLTCYFQGDFQHKSKLCSDLTIETRISWLAWVCQLILVVVTRPSGCKKQFFPINSHSKRHSAF